RRWRGREEAFAQKIPRSNRSRAQAAGSGFEDHPVALATSPRVQARRWSIPDRARPVDLDVAPDQSAWPVRVSRSLDTEAGRGPGLAAVVDVNGEGLRRRAGRPDDRGRTTERG